MSADNITEDTAQATEADLFVYGTLRDADVRRIVFGPRDEPVEQVAGSLPGYRVEQVHARFHPVLVADKGGVAEGLLLQGIGAAAMRRLRYFEGDFGYDLKPVQIGTQGGSRSAVCFVSTDEKPPVDGPWNFADWQQKHKRVFLDICAEIMAEYGGTMTWNRDSFMKGIHGRVLARETARTDVPVCNLRSGLGRDDVKSGSSSLPYNGFFAIEEHRLSHRRFDGGWTPELRRAVFVSADAAVVIPYDAQRDRVLLVEQFRPGSYARGDANPWCLEVVAGRRDQNESFEDTARREAQEEAGLQLGRLERIGRYYSSPGAAAEYLCAFVGEADLSGGGGLHGLLSENEDIRTIVVERSEAMAAVASGEINNAHTILPLLYLELHYQRLRDLWSETSPVAG